MKIIKCESWVLRGHTYTKIIEHQIVVRMNLNERKSVQCRFIQCCLTFLHSDAEAQVASVATNAIAKKMFGQLKVERFFEAPGRTDCYISC